MTYNPPKSFVWSYSKIKNNETCGKRHLNIDILKKFSEGPNPDLSWGEKVHNALAKRIGSGTPLPEGMGNYEEWALRVLEGDNVKIFTELKFGITEDFNPCGFFDKKVWYRGIADVLKFREQVGLVIDWKTGKIKEDGIQLALMAVCVFIHYPQIQKIRSEFVWLNEGPNITSREDFSREDIPKIWAAVLPRVNQLKDAYARGFFPPNPGGLCRNYCPVKDCEYYQKGNRR